MFSNDPVKKTGNKNPKLKLKKKENLSLS